MKNDSRTKATTRRGSNPAPETVPPASGARDRRGDEHRIQLLEEQVARLKLQRSVLLRASEDRWKATTLEEVRSVAIGAVGNLVAALREAGRPAAEWQTLFDILLAAVGAAPSQGVHS